MEGPVNTAPTNVAGPIDDDDGLMMAVVEADSPDTREDAKCERVTVPIAGSAAEYSHFFVLSGILNAVMI
jgi:hypothetical protein